MACSTRFVAVWATVTAPVQTPWIKLPETAGLTGTPLVDRRTTVSVKLVMIPLVRFCA